MTQYGSNTYTYDPEWRRLKKVAGGVTHYYVWEDERLMAEYNSSGTRIARYAYLPGDASPTEVEINNVIYQVRSDHLGTPLELINVSNIVVWRAHYESFGKAVINDDTDNNGTHVEFNVRFPGQYFDAESNLNYNWHRFYSTETGRYLQSDPIGVVGGINTYVYVNDIPIMLTDHQGLAVVGSWLQPPKFNLQDKTLNGIEFTSPDISVAGYLKFIRISGQLDGFINIDIKCTSDDCDNKREWEIHEQIPLSASGSVDIGPNLYALAGGFMFGPYVGVSINIAILGEEALRAEYHFLKLAQEKAGAIIGPVLSMGPTAICNGTRTW